ncbi:hypothetical protein [Delftia lacustris]|uniref:hypothetical protein n=1 Tax=Delftia lacustris TaxID=558537 RepID=UPI0006407DE7|nr:hypothetical protein [Delftia lacustris]
MRDPGWLVADEWFEDFLENVTKSAVRRRNLWRERVVIPARDQLARDYAEKTEQLRRMLAAEASKGEAA